MKLLPLDLLSSHLQRVGPRGFSPHLQAAKVWTHTEKFNPGFVAHMMPKVEWAALPETANILQLVRVPQGPIPGVSVFLTQLQEHQEPKLL
ncbi:hypothetical protein CB1_001390030 [Camelus ferus]|nr:hypothetical protein CB1_001390030 [Camelus ferus]